MTPPDPYPTSTHNAFSDSTTPNSKSYGGAASNINYEIARAGDNITADINVGGVAARAGVYNRKVLDLRLTPARQWAWETSRVWHGRRSQSGSADGVTNMFIALREGDGERAAVYADVDGQLNPHDARGRRTAANFSVRRRQP